MDRHAVRWAAIGSGAVVAVAGTGVLAIVAGIVTDPRDAAGPWRDVVVFGVLGCWVLAGSVAGARAVDAPLTHGMLAAVAAMSSWLVFRGLVGWVRGGDPGYELWAVVSVAGFSAGCGLVGALAASARGSAVALGGARRATSSSSSCGS